MNCVPVAWNAVRAGNCVKMVEFLPPPVLPLLLAFSLARWDAGKNLVQNFLHKHIHDLNRQPVARPHIGCVDIQALFQSRQMRAVSAQCQHSKFCLQFTK